MSQYDGMKLGEKMVLCRERYEALDRIITRHLEQLDALIALLDRHDHEPPRPKSRRAASARVPSGRKPQMSRAECDRLVAGIKAALGPGPATMQQLLERLAEQGIRLPGRDPAGIVRYHLGRIGGVHCERHGQHSSYSLVEIRGKGE